MRVKIIFLAYLRQLHQTDQAYPGLMLGSERVTADELKQYSDKSAKIMEGTTRQLMAANSPERVEAGNKAPILPNE